MIGHSDILLDSQNLLIKKKRIKIAVIWELI